MLIKINSPSFLGKVRKYLKGLGFWFKEFNDTEYKIEVTAEERSKTHRGNRNTNLNPPKAWETCASLVQIWDWDELGRGPWPNNREIQPAGECANPSMLSYISCPKSCIKYKPTNIEASIYIAERVAEEHERRAKVLRYQVQFLKTTDLQYREAIKIGGMFIYENGKFIIRLPSKEEMS